MFYLKFKLNWVPLIYLATLPQSSFQFTPLRVWWDLTRGCSVKGLLISSLQLPVTLRKASLSAAEQWLFGASEGPLCRAYRVPTQWLLSCALHLSPAWALGTSPSSSPGLTRAPPCHVPSVRAHTNAHPPWAHGGEGGARSWYLRCPRGSWSASRWWDSLHWQTGGA